MCLCRYCIGKQANDSTSVTNVDTNGGYNAATCTWTSPDGVSYDLSAMKSTTEYVPLCHVVSLCAMTAPLVRVAHSLSYGIEIIMVMIHITSFVSTFVVSPLPFDRSTPTLVIKHLIHHITHN
jgi:hypothetical protein